MEPPREKGVQAMTWKVPLHGYRTLIWSSGSDETEMKVGSYESLTVGSDESFITRTTSGPHAQGGETLTAEEATTRV